MVIDWNTHSNYGNVKFNCHSIINVFLVIENRVQDGRHRIVKLRKKCKLIYFSSILFYKALFKLHVA